MKLRPVTPCVSNANHGRAYWGLLGNRCGIGDTLTSANKEFNAISGHTATGDSDEGQIVLYNGRFNSSSAGELSDGSGGTATMSASIRCNGQIVGQYTFGGSPTVSIASGGFAVSDKIKYKTRIRKGNVYQIWRYYSNSAGIVYYNSATYVSGALGDDMYVGTSVGALTDNTMAATLNAGGGTHVTTGFAPPVCVLGWTTAPSIIIIGDSIGWGYQDFANVNLNQGIIAKGIQSGLSFLNLCSAGSQATTWRNTANYAPMRLWLLANIKWSHGVDQMGHNDLHVAARAATLVKADKEWLINLAPNTLWTCATITHYVAPGATTDGWTTLANQTADTGKTELDNLNKYITNAGGGFNYLIGQNNGHFDVAGPLVDGGVISGTAKWDVSHVRTLTTDVNATSASANIVSIGSNFLAADVGYGMNLAGAGTAGALYLGGIKTFTNAASDVAIANITSTVAAATCVIGTLVSDGRHPLPAALTLASANVDNNRFLSPYAA